MNDNATETTLSADFWRQHEEISAILSDAVQNAQDENRRMGVPNVYSYNGRILYEAPDGRLVEEDTYEQWQEAVARREGGQ